MKKKILVIIFVVILLVALGFVLSDLLGVLSGISGNAVRVVG
jgi:hypothetical protein